MKTASATSPPPLRLVTTPGSRPADRDEALRRVRSARRHIEVRRTGERFAYLKRVYD